MLEPITSIQQVYQLDPDLEHDVTHLRGWLDDQLHLPQQVTDLQLVTFLTCCGKDLEATKTCVDAHFTIKSECPEFFKNRDPLGEDIENISKIVMVTPLTRLSPEGYRYIIFCLRDPDPTNYVPEHALKLFFLMQETIFKDDPLSPGFIMITDIKIFSLAHMRKISLTLMRKNLTYVQDGIPVQLRAIHVLNTTSVMNALMLLIKPFAKKKSLEMMKFHPVGEPREELYKSIPRECLPKEYDGEDKNLDELCETNLEKMRNNREWYKSEEENSKVDETKRIGKKGYNLNSCSLQ